MQRLRVMGQDSVERFIGRILTDDVFRHDAHKSFDKASMAEGFVFTAEERSALKRLDHDLVERLSLRIDMGIKRSVAFVEFGGDLLSLTTSGNKGKR